MILIGDIGGTNARFGIIEKNSSIIFSSIKNIQNLKCNDFECFEDALNFYIKTIKHHPKIISLAVAGPVDDDKIIFTNNSWKFSKKKIKESHKLKKFLVVNDFVAQATAIPYLSKNHKQILRPGNSIKHTPIIALGPGTGLGFSGLLPTEKNWRPFETEGGNVLLTTKNKLEDEIKLWLQDKEKPVIAETVLSGRGLEFIYEFIIHKYNINKNPLRAEEIHQSALNGSKYAKKSIKIFFNFLANFIANSILTIGARHSVYIAGGMVPKMIPFLKGSDFFSRLSQHGKYSNYVKSVPIYLSSNPNAGLLGARAALDNKNLKHRLI